MPDTVLAAIAAAVFAAAAHAAPVQAPHVEAELVAENAALVPGTNWLALRLVPEKGWHTYWKNPGDSGLPTKLSWALPRGFEAGEIQWPYPHVERLGELANYGYGEETLHLVAVTVPTSARGTTATLAAEARWLVCADICIPGKADLSLELPVAAIAAPDVRWEAAFATARERLPRTPALTGAFEWASGEVRVRIDSADAAGARSVAFYPYAADLVNHAAPQRLARDAQGVRLAQAASAQFEKAPASVTGVAVLEGATTLAYEVVLAPGAVAAVAGTAAPSAAEAPVPVSFAMILGFALLGGLILNLMPCVFPVLAIKAVSVLEAQGKERGHQKGHALAYTAGVVASCLAAAGAILALRAGGEALGWGFQLQSPAFVATVIYLLFALGLSLSGLVQFGTSLMGVGQSLAVRGGYAGSFFTGVLAVVVASPCTAPFMGSALGYALTQPAAVALVVFAVLGLGLALPFLVIGFVPRAAALLPRPGAWMETFKQAMAFPMYLTTVWLAWVLGRQAGVNAMAVVMAGLVLVALASWLLPRPGTVALALRYAALAGAIGLLLHPALDAGRPAEPAGMPSAQPMQPWSEDAVARLRAEGRAVFVDFTADWCITCKLNERVALHTDAVQQAFAARGVVQLEGDWTRADPAITRVLERFGRPGVPLYLLYPPTGEPEMLPQLLTPDTVIDAVKRLP